MPKNVDSILIPIEHGKLLIGRPRNNVCIEVPELSESAECLICPGNYPSNLGTQVPGKSLTDKRILYGCHVPPHRTIAIRTKPEDQRSVDDLICVPRHSLCTRSSIANSEPDRFGGEPRCRHLHKAVKLRKSVREKGYHTAVIGRMTKYSAGTLAFTPLQTLQYRGPVCIHNWTKLNVSRI